VAVIRLIFVEAVARRGRGEGSKRAQSTVSLQRSEWLLSPERKIFYNCLGFERGFWQRQTMRFGGVPKRRQIV